MTRAMLSILCAAALVCAAGRPVVADDESTVQVKLLVADRLTKAAVDATVYSYKTCNPYKVTCIAIDFHFSQQSPLTIKCSKGEMLYARLSINGYVQQSTSAVCSPVAQPILLLATKDRDPEWLMRAGNELLDRGKPAEAAVLLTEANAQRPTDASREAALLAAARALKINTDDALVFDKLQQKKVATTTFVDAVKAFQASKGLTADGLLGSQTIGALFEANSSGEAFRKLAIQSPLGGPS